MEPSWWEFVTSPGAGGAAAVVAAFLALAGVRARNAFESREAGRDRAQAASLADEAEVARRWWELAMWTWSNRDDLRAGGVLEMLCVLENEGKTGEQQAILAGIVLGLREEGEDR